MQAPQIPSKAIIIYKHSRYDHELELAKQSPKAVIHDTSDSLTQDLKAAHENNLRSIDVVTKTVQRLGIDFVLKNRRDVVDQDLIDRLVICVGGDGTLLDASHHCIDSPLLGVNSDPKSSIGALCIAKTETIDAILRDIFAGVLKPFAASRLQVTAGGRPAPFLALNDVLFCHKNPACMSRFSITHSGKTEIHHSSGLWIASAAGSTGAIFSAGAPCLNIEANKALLCVREPYWCDQKHADFLISSFGAADKLLIRSRMDDACAFIDGPHENLALEFGESLEIGIAEKPLWLYAKSALNANRQKIIEQRLKMRGRPC